MNEPYRTRYRWVPRRIRRWWRSHNRFGFSPDGLSYGDAAGWLALLMFAFAVVETILVAVDVVSWWFPAAGFLISIVLWLVSVWIV